MNYNIVRDQLRKKPGKWLVTGAAGFIGSNLVETLLKFNQHENFGVRLSLLWLLWGNVLENNGVTFLISIFHECRWLEIGLRFQEIQR